MTDQMPLAEKQQIADASTRALEELRGSVLWYERPCDPVGLDDWKALDPRYVWDLPPSMRPRRAVE